jgi:hypothetical protein
MTIIRNFLHKMNVICQIDVTFFQNKLECLSVGSIFSFVYHLLVRLTTYPLIRKLLLKGKALYS